MKICRLCNEFKELENFHKKKDTKDGRRNECKECMKKVSEKYRKKEGFLDKRKEYDKKRYEENKETILEQKRNYYLDNKEVILEKKSKWRENNKHIGKKWRENNKERLNSLQKDYREKNPHVVAWRAILYRVLNYLDKEKESHTIEELGYSAKELKEHIESLFKEGMDWNNWGEWHIDHIKPLTKFDKKEDLKKINALENLQPLWAKENLIKSNKI